MHKYEEAYKNSLIRRIIMAIRTLKGAFSNGIMFEGINIFILAITQYSKMERNKRNFVFGLTFPYSLVG